MFLFAYGNPAAESLGKIAVFLAMITTVVCLHELGHYVTARWFGVHVKTFAVGFGRKLFAIRSSQSGTVYQLNLLPMGGYCRLKSTDDNAGPIDPRSNVSPIWAARSYDNDSLDSKRPLKRLVIMLAGPAMNFIIAIPLLLIAYSVLGTVAPTVVVVAAGSPADRAGIAVGDRIVAVNGGPPVDARGDALPWWVAPHKTLSVTYRHGAMTHVAQLTPVARRRGTGQTLGLEVKMQTNRLSFPNAFVRSGQAFGALWNGTWANIRSLVIHPAIAIRQFSGPVGIAKFSGQVQDFGWGLYFTFAATISIGLGIFNLLPVPGLDGGQVAFILVEMLRGGKRLARNQEAVFYAGGIALLIMFFVVTTYHDISTLFTRHKG